MLILYNVNSKAKQKYFLKTGAFTMKILVVDDSSTMRRILKNSLHKLGYENVLEAGDGIEAQKILNDNKDLKLAFIDWSMPNMNGFELLQGIKKDAELRHIPVLMVATETEKCNIVKAIKAGAINYVIKPFTSEIIAEKVKTVLG